MVSAGFFGGGGISPELATEVADLPEVEPGRRAGPGVRGDRRRHPPGHRHRPGRDGQGARRRASRPARWPTWATGRWRCRTARPTPTAGRSARPCRSPSPTARPPTCGSRRPTRPPTSSATTWSRSRCGRRTGCRTPTRWSSSTSAPGVTLAEAKAAVDHGGRPVRRPRRAGPVGVRGGLHRRGRHAADRRLRPAGPGHRHRPHGHRQHAVAVGPRADPGAGPAAGRGPDPPPGAVDGPVGVGAGRHVRRHRRHRARRVPGLGAGGGRVGDLGQRGRRVRPAGRPAGGRAAGRGVAGVVAGLRPARRAARLDVLEAIAAE